MTAPAAPPCNDLWTIPGETPPPPPGAEPDYHELQLRDFLLSPTPSVTAGDGRAVVEVIERIYARRAHF
jgi:hypothetical protein